MSQHHKINYVEMATVDLAATKAFFSAAFSWQFVDYGPEYSSFTTQGVNGGFYHVNEAIVFPQGTPLIVLYSDNLAGSMSQVTSAGGDIVKALSF